MKAGVLSDSHGQREGLQRALALLQQEHAPQVLLHLGDSWEDALWLAGEISPAVYAVPGVYDAAYSQPEVANRRELRLQGWRLFLTHTPRPHRNDAPADPDPAAVAALRKADVILHGHTHAPRLEREGPVLWVCPGHLKEGRDKGYAPSLAVLSLEPRAIRAELVDVDSGVVFAQETLEAEL